METLPNVAMGDKPASDCDINDECNCKDCKFCLRGIYGSKYYCVHPKTMYYAGAPVEILFINQPFNCDYYMGAN